MKTDYKKDTRRIQKIISMIQNRLYLSPENDLVHYQELLTLSENTRNKYGQALAHVNLAQYYQIINDIDLYNYHLKHAKTMADNNGYLDVIIDYYNLKGFEYLNLNDDVTALSSYLEGVKVAEEIKDSIYMAIFYNNIAEIFYDAKDYHAAISFYLKSYNALVEVESDRANVYKKTALFNLVGVYFINKDVNNAVKYYEITKSINVKTGYLPAAFIYTTIKVLLLTDKRQEALKELDNLLLVLRDDKTNIHMMAPIYIEALELALALLNKEHAKWCVSILNSLNDSLSAKMRLQSQALAIRYYELFDITENKIYERFHEITKINEQVNRKSTVETINSFINLYDANKKQREIQDVRNDLEEIAELDELTKVLNRRHYNKILSKFIHDQDVSRIACMMIDIDYFKDYNDYYGHREGDQAIVEVADALKTNLITNSYLSRFGGDEFSIIFIDHNDDEIVDYIKSVQTTLSNKAIEHIKNKASKVLSLSIGFYNTTREATGEKLIIKKADDALYIAKNKGRNTYSKYIED